jgi:hypothetical protein
MELGGSASGADEEKLINEEYKVLHSPNSHSVSPV